MQSNEFELVQVIFVGGSFNGVRTLMLHPEGRMRLECQPAGGLIVYMARLAKQELVDGALRTVVIYAPENISDDDFTVQMAQEMYASERSQ